MKKILSISEEQKTYFYRLTFAITVIVLFSLVSAYNGARSDFFIGLVGRQGVEKKTAYREFSNAETLIGKSGELVATIVQGDTARHIIETDEGEILAYMAIDYVTGNININFKPGLAIKKRGTTPKLAKLVE